LCGIIEILDYLKTLGVDLLWLNPIYSSPDIDNGLVQTTPKAKAQPMAAKNAQNHGSVGICGKAIILRDSPPGYQTAHG
jgi:glycosidase